MGQATSCAYWIASAETGAAHSRERIPVIQADASSSEDLKSSPRPVALSGNARTAYRPPSETLKLLKAKKSSEVSQETKKASEERWAKTKAEWEARVTAEIEERERLNQPDQAMPGTEADRYAPDERQLALQAIKEDMEEEERQRAKSAEVPGDACQGDRAETAQMDSDAACEAPISAEALDSAEVCEATAPLQHLSSTKVCTGDEEIGNPRDDDGEQPEAADRKAILDAFLANNGFDGVSNKRRRMLRPSVYPLHLAAEKGDAQLIRLLLEAGADRLLKDSSGRTPEDVAKRKNKKGSHDEALASLAAL